MFQREFWKASVTCIIILFAVFCLIPLTDQPFDQFVAKKASSQQEEFSKLMDEVAQRVQANPATTTTFVALRDIARERQIDLSLFFPEIKLESSLKNVNRRNEILLDYLIKKSKGRLQLGLDLKGGVAFTLEVGQKAAAAQGETERKENLAKAIDIIGERINGLGVTEPLIRAIGDNRIEVQLPGVSVRDNPDIVKSLKKPARLDFRIVHPTLSPRPGVAIPPGYEIMTIQQELRNGETRDEEYFVKRIPEITGEAVSNSVPTMDQYGRFKIIIEFTKEGQKRFADVTRSIEEDNKRFNKSRGSYGQLAIVLDGRLYSAPSVEHEINSPSAEITGSFSQREAVDLANVLNNPLDVELDIKEQYEVGPSLAQDAIDSGVKAALIGTVLVAAFMITFYTTGGLVAVLVLAVNLVIIAGIMASVGVTMTLPGLAGIVLTVGMAVDANILIFERMREELAIGKSLAVANQTGYVKALWTILDAHAVQLIICAIMIWLGTGPIKGFGVTLAIGVISTLISVLITGHMVMEMLTESGWLRKFTMRRMLGDLRVDFVKWGKPAAIGSILLVLVSLGYVIHQGNRIYGIDFVGGDVISLQFDKKIDTALVRETARSAGVDEISPTYISPIGEGREILNIETPEGKSGLVLEALRKNHPEAAWQLIGENHIGASIGKEIQWNAFLAVGVSMLTILLYIAFRFEFGFGIGAMASTLHDILMNIGIFVLFGHKFSAPMVAAILCIAGYSINETVVVFDRIREELKLNPTDKLRVVVNNAIRKVFARTIMTATTTFLAALSLFLFGSGVLRDISFCFLVGIITSTFSAVFIAAQVFYVWHKGDRKHVEEHHELTPKYEWVGSSKASE